ncbi:MAG: hypothetical protein ACE5K7_04665 [Phycisphaerae bacterium]
MVNRRTMLMFVSAVVGLVLGGQHAAAECPGYRWAYTAGAESDDVAHAVAADAAGDIYLAGRFVGQVNFDPAGSDVHSSNGQGDVFVTKLSADGSHQWTRTFGGPDDDLAEDLAVDSTGAVYAVGLFRGANVDFDPTEGTDLHSSNGSADVFLIRLEADGSYGWAVTLGGAGFEHGRAVAIDPDDQPVLAGYFVSSSLDFDPTSGTDLHYCQGLADVFITKLSAAGQYLWTRTIGGPDVDIAFDLVIDSLSEIIVTGSFQSSEVDFDPGPAVDLHQSNGSRDVFALKLAGDGSYRWAATFGGPLFDHGYAVAVDQSRRVYLAGTFQGSNVDFDPGPAEDLHSSLGSDDVFVAAFEPDGTYRSAATFGGFLSDLARDVITDSRGGLLLIGEFDGTAVDFDPTVGLDPHSSSGLSDIFVTRLGLDFSYRWTVTIGADQPDSGFELAARSDGDIVLAGYFAGQQVDLDPTDGADLRSSAGLGDICLVCLAGPLQGDFDCDRDVDLADFQQFAGAMRGSSVPPARPDADLDGDGDCDLQDFQIFLANWGGPG